MMLELMDRDDWTPDLRILADLREISFRPEPGQMDQIIELGNSMMKHRARIAVLLATKAFVDLFDVFMKGLQNDCRNMRAFESRDDAERFLYEDAAS